MTKPPIIREEDLTAESFRDRLRVDGDGLVRLDKRSEEQISLDEEKAAKALIQKRASLREAMRDAQAQASGKEPQSRSSSDDMDDEEHPALLRRAKNRRSINLSDEELAEKRRLQLSRKRRDDESPGR